MPQIAETTEKENSIPMKSKIENFVPGSGIIGKAAKKAEERSHICERSVNDILDEIGDCLHDDVVFRRKILNAMLHRPKMKQKIASKLAVLITQ